MLKILVVEDEPDVRAVIETYLQAESFESVGVGTIGEMYNALEDQSFEGIILDLMLPDGDAIDEIPALRVRTRKSFLLILTAKRSDREKIYGLEIGADDYLTKPFHPRELIARVKAILRRKGIFQNRELSHGSLRLLLDARKGEIDGQKIDLSYKEFALLEMMMEHPGKVFTRAELLDGVWPNGESSDRIVDVYMNLIRKKIGKDMLVTVRGIGYRLSHE
jgi:two-component system OmpR family response regulator